MGMGQLLHGHVNQQVKHYRGAQEVDNSRCLIPFSFFRSQVVEVAFGLRAEHGSGNQLAHLWIEHPTVVGGPVGKTTPTYPDQALHQLLRNALLHRTYEGSNALVGLTWYDDRTEIQSPGGTYGQMTLENFGTPGLTDYRNPTLAEALKNLAYVEKFGVGLAIVRQALERTAIRRPSSPHTRPPFMSPSGNGHEVHRVLQHQGGNRQNDRRLLSRLDAEERGIRVLMLDLDPHANLTEWSLGEERTQDL
jgi:hypothetical protein